MNNVPAGKNRRVLVIDDNRAIHDDFRKILSPAAVTAAALEAAETALFGRSTETTGQTQFEVDSAYQGQEGVLLVKKALEAGLPYAMAFVDVRMPPGWDGVETTRKIWELDPNLQVVLCTAYSDYSWGEMFEKLGHSDGLLILKKPFDAVEAFQMAHALTEKWWLHRESRQKMEELENRVAVRTRDLQWKTAFLEAQLNSSIDGILVVDQEGKRSIFQNQRFAGLFKFPEHIARENDDENRLRWAKDMTKNPEQFLERVRHLYANRDEISRDEVDLKDGTVLDRYSSPVVGEDGKYYGRIWTYRDITARKQAEDALQRLRDQYALILNSVGDGVHGLGLDGRITFENPVSAAMLGYEVADLIGRPAHSTMHHSRSDGTPYPQCECPIYATLGDGLVHHVTDEVFWRKDGTSFPVEYTTSPLRGEDGGITGVIVVFTDITERKRIEAHLFQSQKMETVGRLAGGVAHEFNSIMTAIIGQSELLLNDLPPGNPMCKNATEIRKAAERAAILTRQLLAYGRKQILQPEILDLNAVLSGMESTLRHLMGRDTDVRFAATPLLNAVRADAGQIEQVILNMAMNALDAMPNGGKLTLETANVTLDQEYVSKVPELKPGEYVMVAITDTGTGLSEEVKARMFEPFFSTKGVGRGTGLGLATCYGIIKQSGGHISCYSEPARGAIFKIYLPQVEQKAKASIQRLDSPGLPRGTETILLVEDDPALRGMAATLLGRLGYNVLAAANGIEALNLKQQPGTGHIDLLFTDVVMPHMSGRELADRVRALYPHTRILFTSAYTENAIVHQGVLDKGVALLQKPFTPSALAQKLRQVLDEKSGPAASS